MAATPKNDRDHSVTRFCRSLEEFRRTDEGRVRDAKALVDHFFPYDESKVEDRLFVHIPKEVRGKVLAGWGIRGLKSALRDDDDRVRSTVHDALLAGDIDVAVFEEGVTAEILTDWVALADWWSFWRGKKLELAPVRKALAIARDLRLFDDRWFLLHVEGRGGKLIGTDAICDTLSKENVIAWVRALHSSGDGTPNGIVGAIGWEKILSTTSHEALLFALDALAREIGLVPTADDADPDATTAPRLPSGAPPPPAAPTIAAPPGDHDDVENPARPTDLPDQVVEELFSADDLPPPQSQEVPAAGPTGFQKEESWWPERAEPGDMGWDLAYGVRAPMAPPVKPQYGFGEDDTDEPTSEIQIPDAQKSPG